MAAIGITQLERIDFFKTKRQKIVNRYIQELNTLDDVNFLDLDFNEVLSHIIVLKVKNRDELREYLVKNNIECGVHYKPNHMHTKYVETFSLPVTENIYANILSLPCHVDLTESEHSFVIEKVKEFYEG